MYYTYSISTPVNILSYSLYPRFSFTISHFPFTVVAANQYKNRVSNQCWGEDCVVCQCRYGVPFPIDKYERVLIRYTSMSSYQFHTCETNESTQRDNNETA